MIQFEIGTAADLVVGTDRYIVAAGSDSVSIGWTDRPEDLQSFTISADRLVAFDDALVGIGYGRDQSIETITAVSI